MKRDGAVAGGLRGRRRPGACPTLIALLAATVLAQNEVRIDVDAASTEGPYKPVWTFFGYDEPNYTYMKDGRKLLTELSTLSPATVYVRTHNLLTSGDGTAALKWGSTNAYTEDAGGNPKYDWRVVDRIFDTFVERRMKPIAEIGFMPEALSRKPEPYRHHWDPSQPYRDIFTGWAHPPRDYTKWAALVYEWVRHCVARYGEREVASWYWEVWNEPDIGYWQGTPEEYFKLYDYSAEAAKRALPSIRVGGPTSTGPGGDKAAKFLRDFLEHVVRTGAPLDYITFHAKGRPKVVNGHVQMGSEFQLRDIDRGFEIVSSFPKLKYLPVIIGESDPEGCAACPVQYNPQNAYRNGVMYSSYTAAIFAREREIAARRGVNFAGAVTWAFEFEDQPYFAGFRDLATNGIDKPVLNVFRIFGLAGGVRIAAKSSGAAPLEEMEASGVKGAPDVNAAATRGERTVDVIVWNYHDDDLPAPDARVALSIAGVNGRVLVRHYRVDTDHSNSYTAWKALGSPPQPSSGQYEQMERAGQLEQLRSPEWVTAENGTVRLGFALPRHAVSLVQLSW
jgi:xylan 1,4-beta-xylosidase